MSILLKISIWKKDTNQYTSMPDYQIEIKDGDSYIISSILRSLDSVLLEKAEGEGIKR